MRVLLRERTAHFSIMTILVVTGAAALSFRFLMPVRVSVRMTQEQAISELQRVAGLPYAVIFADVRWTSFAFERKQFENFAIEYRSQSNRPEVQFVVIDFSNLEGGYAPFSQWEGWTETQKRNAHVGEWFWIKDGRIVDSASANEFRSPTDAVDRTVQLFSARTRPY